MKHIRFFVILLVFFQTINLKAVGYIDILGVNRKIDTLEHRVVGPGIVYTRFVLPELPLAGYMLTVDLSNPYNFLETFQAHNQVGRTEAMTAAYHRLMGERRTTIAGVNANFWIVAGQGEPAELLGVPHSGSIRSGEMVTDPNNWNRGRGGGDIDIGFAMLDAANRMWIDDIKFSGTVKIAGAGEHSISRINRIRGENELVFFNSYLGNQPTRTDNTGIEVFIKPISGQSWAVNQEVEVEVVRIIANQGRNLLQDGESVLSGAGTARIFLENLSVGDRLTVNMGITTITDNQQPLVKQLVTGNALVMKNGELTHRNFNEDYNTMIQPRTGIGSSADGKTLYLIVIDGRSPHSPGASTATMSGILKAAGASNAVSLDGGGSAQMMLKGGIVSRPSDGRERPVANGWFLFHSAPEDDVVTKIRFGDRVSQVPSYSMYRPHILGYNQFDVLVNENVANFTITVSENIGYVSEDGFFVAAGFGTGTLTVEYNGSLISRQISVVPGVISLALESVLIDNRTGYAIEVFSTFGNERRLVPPQLLTWKIEDNEICTIENGVLKGLKNGTTTITGTLGDFEASMQVRVEIPESAVMRASGTELENWTMTANRYPTAVLNEENLPENWDTGIAVNFTHQSGVAPSIVLRNSIPFFGLPDTVKIVLNIGDIALANTNPVSVALRANNSTQNVLHRPTNLPANQDFSIVMAMDDMFDTADRAVYPIWFENINFNIRTGGMTIGRAYTLAVKEIRLVFAGFLQTNIPIVNARPSFFVFPNPAAHGMLNLVLSENTGQTVRTEIFNLQGQLVSSETHGTFSGAPLSLSIHNLPAGTYLLRVFENEQAGTMQFIVK